jgi:hypothetical protein
MAYFDNNKEYPNRKDWRKPYRDSKRVDARCRNGGDCPWCQGNRHKSVRIKLASFEQQITDYGLEGNPRVRKVTKRRKGKIIV